MAPGAPRDRWTWAELVTLGVVALLFLLGAPALMLYKLDGDAYAVGSFAADALAGLPLNGTEPLVRHGLGTRRAHGFQPVAAHVLSVVLSVGRRSTHAGGAGVARHGSALGDSVRSTRWARRPASTAAESTPAAGSVCWQLACRWRSTWPTPSCAATA